jgi:integrase
MKKIEPYLYEHLHRAKGGEVSVRYYAIFTSWDRQPLTKPLGTDINIARAKLQRLRDLNQAKVRVELDEEKALREELERQKQEREDARKGKTFAEFGQEYFDDIIYPDDENNPDCHTWDGIKRKSTVHGQELRFKTLRGFFGDRPLVDIESNHAEEYRRKRLREGVQFPTANRELSFLIFMLGQAAKRQILKAVPVIELPSEQGRARQQTISLDEYEAILANMQRPQQRVVICWWETSMRHEEPLKLQWPMIDLRANLIRMPASITKERSDRRVPISWELRQVLVELKEERLKTGVRNHDFVFIRENGVRIRDITRAWEFALNRAKLTDRRPHDFRRTRISAWTDAGVQTEAVKWWSGHKDSSVHAQYVIVTDEIVLKPFREKGWLLPPSERKQQTAVAG